MKYAAFSLFIFIHMKIVFTQTPADDIPVRNCDTFLRKDYFTHQIQLTKQ